jgi:single-strand DNA-binding protein
MGNHNRVTLMGHLTKDPEVRDLPSGMKVADMRIAVNESRKNKDGEQVEKTCYVDLVSWGRQAELCGEILTKGSPLFVDGRLEFDEWETKDGDKRSKLRVKASQIEFLKHPEISKS